ncbi:3-oxoacyl-ACP reductase FabG [Paracoccaceae bacterium Fryx2]|nr:3-oxoacyl-ACP reductase FabG [Paracoccaceae bacterium Fryx2]
MSASLKGRSVLVTGGSKGIGKGIAQVFAEAGARVAILSRNRDQAEAAAAEIGHGTIGLAGDVTSLESMEAAMAAVVAQHGGLDVLCANAGIFPPARLEEMTSDQWDEVIDTNLKGTFHSVRAAIPHLRASDQGRIVITSSITGPVTGYPGWTHYGASKAGQLGFMRTACIELAKYGITVNAVMPGNIITEGLEGMGAEYQASMAASVPLKRLGTVADIGHAALYFASREAGYVTGQTIIVDGGQILPESLEALAQA